MNVNFPKVFDDVAVELTMAILQFFQSDPSEEQIFRTCKALMRFLEVRRQISLRSAHFVEFY